MGLAKIIFGDAVKFWVFCPTGAVLVGLLATGAYIFFLRGVYLLSSLSVAPPAGRGQGCKWDNRTGKESTGATLFALFYEALPQTLTTAKRPLPEEMILDEKVKLLYLLETAALWLQLKHGAIDVPWGRTHRIRRGTKNYALGGCTTKAQSLRIAGIDAVENGVAYCRHGSAYTMTVVLSDPVRC